VFTLTNESWFSYEGGAKEGERASSSPLNYALSSKFLASKAPSKETMKVSVNVCVCARADV